MKELKIEIPTGYEIDKNYNQLKKEKKFIVYRHISPSGKVYVGITSNIPSVRWGKAGNQYKGSRIFYNAIKKYGWDNFKHEILLENQPEKAAKYTEKYLIKWYKIHKVSYNITDGGEGTLGFSHPMSEKCKEALRIANTGRKLTQEQKENLRKIHTGKKASSETIEKLRLSHLGHKDSEETKRKKSLNRKGKKLSKESIEKLRNSKIGRTVPEAVRIKIRNALQNNSIRNKPILQYTLDGKFIREFISSAEAGRITGADPSEIRKVVRGIHKQCKGFIWKEKVQ